MFSMLHATHLLSRLTAAPAKDAQALAKCLSSKDRAPNTVSLGSCPSLSFSHTEVPVSQYSFFLKYKKQGFYTTSFPHPSDYTKA